MHRQENRQDSKKAFTLVETLVGTAVFLVIAVAFVRVYLSIFAITALDQYKTLALDLANQQFEIVRNLSYANVGEVSGIPNGVVPHTQTLVRGGITFSLTTTIRNINYGLFAMSSTTANNKLVEVEVDCSTCKNYIPIVLTTTIAPKNLETASTNGALFIKVFDANGIPVPEANVHIVNSQATSTIIIDDVTDDNGILDIVDVPPGVQAYNITVSKPGYSTSQTYPPGGVANGYANPTPTQPDATVVLQQVTQASFAIDKLSTLNFSSVTPLCTAVPNVNFSLTGSKTVGVGIPKFSQNLATNSSGQYSSSTIEWDSYDVVGADSVYDVVGINPLNLVDLNPNSTQNVQLVVAPKNPKSLLVTIKDSSTGLPVTDAQVTLTGPAGYSSVQTTDRGSINQTDWSGGSGQDYPSLYTNLSQYATDDGGIDTGSPAGEIKLKNIFGNYVSSGMLQSSTIDTGSASNFYSLAWAPTDEPLATGPNSVRFQFATNKTITATTTWNYLGPDGTSATYYTTANQNLNSIHNGDEYARYELFLSTQTATSTPDISDIGFTFTSSCTPPGQVVFPGLASGTYQVTVSKTGYTTNVTSVPISTNWTEQQIILGP